MSNTTNGVCWIQTYTGRQFWPLKPKPEDVDIRDIAHALSLICRFTGHTREFYSVAQHSVLMSDRFEPQWGLLHDAAEAYIADVARPVKRALPEYKMAEDRILATIGEKFGLELPIPDTVHNGDLILLATERRDLMGKCVHPWACLDCVEPLDDYEIQPWVPQFAEQSFLERFSVVFSQEASK